MPQNIHTKGLSENNFIVNSAKYLRKIVRLSRQRCLSLFCCFNEYDQEKSC